MRVLVTGAGGGIGRAVVAALAAEGAQVAACDLTTPEVDGAATAVGFDVRDGDAVARGVADAVDALGGLDGVVANAGVVDTIHRAERFPTEAWQGDLDANLTGQFLVAQAAFPALDAGGAVVFVSSASAETGLPGQVAYTAAKAGVVGMMRTLAAEWGPRGVRVNAVLPGMIATPKVLALPEPVLAGVTRTIPLGRVGAPAEVAALIAFLLRPGYVHGQAVRADGGLGLAGSALAG